MHAIHCESLAAANRAYREEAEGAEKQGEILLASAYWAAAAKTGAEGTSEHCPAVWAEYRVTAHEAIDVGDRVLALSRSFGRLEGSPQEVREAPAAVWTVHDGKIARAQFYPDRAQGLKAVGLEE